jgi:hypothetical protein
LFNANRPPPTILIGLIDFLSQIIRQSIVPSQYQEPIARLGRYLGLSLATASDLRRDEPWRVGTLCDTIYRRTKSVWPPTRRMPENIRLGEWTLLIVYEPGFLDKSPGIFYSILRYAFVSADESDSNIIIADIEEFLQRAFLGPEDAEKKKELLAVWKKRLDVANPEIPEQQLSLCGRPEVESWLRSSDFHPFEPLSSESDID